MRHAGLPKEVAAAFLLTAGSAAPALVAVLPGPEWTEANRTAEFVIFYRDDEKLQARQIQAVTEIDATPERVFAVLTDYEHLTEYMPFTKENTVLERRGEGDLIIYQYLSLPVVSDRDYVMHTTHSRGPAGELRVTWDAIPGVRPPRDGVVRVLLNRGGWVLEPLADGKRTRATYRLVTSPGGSIPRFAANLSNTRAVPALVDAVRRRSLDPKWRP